jgi:AcrR family transcriptional regulator
MDGRTARWEAHKEAQRLRIVEAAIDLYDEGRLDASLQDIGARAGVSRSVVYRQFADRDDLDRAVQQHVLAHLWELIGPTLTLGPTVRETLRRPVATYIDWALAHPNLLRVAERDHSPGSARDQAIRGIATAVADALVLWFTAAGAAVSEADRAATDPLAHGLVGAVYMAVGRWLELGASVPDRDHLVELVVDAAWALVDVRLRAYGLVVDPDAPTETVVPPS